VKDEFRSCSICGAEFQEENTDNVFTEAGEWLSEEIWQEKGQLCRQCLENRAKLAMMYIIDR
jgi:hypothetical protein